MQYIFAKKIKKNDIIFDKTQKFAKNHKKTRKIFVFEQKSSQKNTFSLVKKSFEKSDKEKMKSDSELVSFINKYTDRDQSVNTSKKDKVFTAFCAVSGENL